MRIQAYTPDAARKRGAFTLMEVMVVVAILVVLAGVASIFVFRYLEDAKIGAAKTTAKTLEKACDSYKLKYDAYPDNLQQLLTPPAGSPFVETILDPWGHEYKYDPSANNGMKPEISTVDPNGNPISNLQVAGAQGQQNQPR